MKRLVIVSLEAWDEVWRRNQHLIANLMNQDSTLEVLFVEPATDPVHNLRSRRAPHRGAGLRRVSGRLHTFQPTKWLPRRLDGHSDERLMGQVKATVGQLGWSDPVLWINDPVGVILLSRTGWRSLYDLTDDWTVAVRTEQELERTRAWEESLLTLCDEVVACSQRLIDVKGTYRDISLIPNAVDVAPYRGPIERPPDLPAGRTALYLGTAHRDRLDVELCISTAQALGQEGTVVLVGPAPLSPKDIDAMLSAGVVLLGPKPSADVPAYLTHADVLLVPHVITPFTESLDPIKAYEYRAAGRPVVATAVPGFREAEGSWVTLAAPKHFPSTVTEIIRAGAQGRGVPENSLTEVPSWAERAQQMRVILDRLWSK